MARPKISITRRLLYAAVTILVLFGLAELGCALLWQRFRIEGIFVRDATLRWVLPAGGQANLGDVGNRINSLGYRGPELAPRKAACALRVFGAGDSSVFGHGVADGGAFLELLDGTSVGRLKLQSVNGGVPGYSTYQTLLQLEHGAWALEPDLLIIANLWSDGAQSRVTDRQFFQRALRPRGSAGGRLMLLLGHSKLYTLAVSQLHGPQVVYDPRQQGPMVRRVPLAEYRANLRRMIRGIRSRGGQALLLMLPHISDQAALDDEENRRLRAEIRREGHSETAHDYRHVMRAVSRELKVELLQMPVWVAAEKQPLFLDDLHPNAAGHRIIAQKLRAVIKRRPALWQAAARRCSEGTP